MWKITDISQELVKARLEVVLRRYVGPGTPFSFALLAEKGGFHYNSIENWYNGRTSPESPQLLKLCLLLGPEFFNDLVAPAGLCGLKWADTPDANALRLNCELTGAAAILAKALEDGRIDDREHNALRPVLSKLITQLQNFNGAAKER